MLVCVALCAAVVRADHEGAGEASRAPVAPEPEATPIAPIAPEPQLEPEPEPRREALRSTFTITPRDTSSLGVVARRAGRVLLGDRALTIASPWARGASWSSTALGSGAVSSFAAPLRVFPSGQIGPFAENAWPAGDVLVANDGAGTLLVHPDGRVVRGDARGRASTLGAAAIGTDAIVWWRIDATRTEVERIDRTTARSLWRRPGPTWSWDARLVIGRDHVALLADREISVLDAATGATRARFALAAMRPGLGWPHAFALASGSLVVAATGGVVVIDLASGARRTIRTGAPALPAIVAVDPDDERAIVIAQGAELFELDLARDVVRWTVRAREATALRVVRAHVVLCDGDGGATVIERATGAARLRVGVGGCDDVRARDDGTIAIAGSRETWIVGPAAPRPAVDVEGAVVLDGAPAAALPVLIGALGVPLDGADGCPPVPEYARCVITDRAGRFRARIHALGLLPITVDVDAAARRAGRPRAIGGHAELDLDAPSPVRLEVEGADHEL